MCGIAGIQSADPPSKDRLAGILTEMTDPLIHRGPDEGGQFIAPGVALGSRRLKVIDLATGRMPISNENGTVWVVYNGEVYNHHHLRKALERRGHVFRTNSDTEVLVHMYEDYGIDFVKRLVGMFAFALWDTQRQTLYLVRDRMGIKPLYYRATAGTLSFASELKSLLAVVQQDPEIDLDSLCEYVALGYIRSPRTIYRGYRKLSPGTILQWQRGQLETWRYWHFPSTSPAFAGDVEDAVDALQECLSGAVKDRLIADVPLGFFLSGGIDSSLIVALAAENASGPVKTFSVGFRGDDDLDYARAVAREFNTDHHELVLEPDSCDRVENLIDYFDEPFGDSSCIPTYFVSKLARAHVTVALSGDGGDELFAGYDQYVHDSRLAWTDRVPPKLRRAIFGGLTKILPPGTYGRRRLRALAVSRQERYARYVSHELDPRSGGLLRPDLIPQIPTPAQLFESSFREAEELPIGARLLYADATNYLPDDILTKVDRMSMAHSLEARVPLLDHRFVELAASLPVNWKLRNGQTKWVLKQLARRHLPAEIIDRPKRGFSIPVDRWLRGPLSPLLTQLLDTDARTTAYLHRPTVERLVKEHRTRRRNHSYVLWRLITLERWIRRNENAGERMDTPFTVAMYD